MPKIDLDTIDRRIIAALQMPEIVACHLVSGEADYLLEVVVPDVAHYQRFLVDRLLNLSIAKEVRSSFAIQTLKAGAPLPLDHLAAADDD
jgi:Lrp/AsnC family leucine-responsive transcriptional regulator